MNLFRSRHSSRSRRFIPQCERFETRECPSVSVVVHGHTLIVTGDAANNTVSITDDGAGNVSANIDGTTGGGAGISRIIVNTGAGDDSLTYTLGGALKASESLLAFLGAGNDTAKLDYTPGVDAGKLRVDMAGGAGNDTLSASFGHVALGASAAVEMEGGAGDDQLNLDFAGALNGTFAAEVEGGKGNDTTVGTITIDAGSKGKLKAEVEDEKGTNNLTLNVIDNTAVNGVTGLARLKAKIEAGKNDVVTHTDNVRVERD